MDLDRDVVGDISTRGSVVMAMTVSTDPVPAAKVALVAITVILTDHGMCRGRLRGAGGGVSYRGDKKHGGDQGHSQNQSCPCRH